jgi:DNA-binding response OmpR family regulator
MRCVNEAGGHEMLVNSGLSNPTPYPAARAGETYFESAITDMNRKPTSPLSGLRVLVAEDELLISQFIREILLDLGCAVVGPVRNLGDALHAIGTDDIDGALLDVQLGEASIEPVANDLALRRIPFILMTGRRDLGGSAAALSTAPVLTKPFNVRQLEDMMSSIFRAGDRGEPGQS